MFFKLIRYDLKVGFSTTYKRYLMAAALFIVIFISFQLLLHPFHPAAHNIPEGNLGSLLLYAFGGMEEYIPSPGEPFRFPAFWMLLYLLLSYITLYYPFNDLEEFGQHLLIRSGGRKLWWLSKCIWNLSSVVCFFLLAWLIFAVGCLVTGTSLSLELSTKVTGMLQINPEKYAQFPASLTLQIFLLPLLVMAALNLFQMTLSLFIKPFYSFIATAAVLITSAYYLSPFLIGNYAMPLRSDQLVGNGVGLAAGIFFAAILALLSVVAGGVAFQRRDILKGDG